MPYKDPEKRKAVQRARYDDPTYGPRTKARLKEYRKNNPVGVMLAAAKHRAKRRGLDFTLAPEDIVVPEYCPILGIKLQFGHGTTGRSNNSPSLDRKDNTKGYTQDNVWVISQLANAMKYTADKEQLVAFAKWVLKEHT